MAATFGFGDVIAEALVGPAEGDIHQSPPYWARLQSHYRKASTEVSQAALARAGIAQESITLVDAVVTWMLPRHTARILDDSSERT